MDRILNIPNSFRKKSRERITIMFVPEHGDHIYSFQLNYSIIIFLSILCFGLIMLAGMSFYTKYEAESEREFLHNRYGILLEYSIKIDEEAKSISNGLKELKSILVKLAEFTELPEKEILGLNIYQNEFNELNELNKKKLNSNKNLNPRLDFLPPVYKLRKTINYSLANTHLLNRILLSYKKGFGLLFDMPLGRPFKDFTGLHDTSGFGRRIDPIARVGSEFHDGFDTAGAIGIQIYSTAPGWVYKSGYNEGYGRSVVVSHANGYYTAYAHLSSIYVRVGEYVKRGSRIGALGRTGRVTGPHLHYEIHIGSDNRVNPLEYICARDYYTNTCQYYHNR